MKQKPAESNRTAHTVQAKKSSLLKAIDWTRPELAGVAAAADPAQALLQHLARPPWRRFRFEFDRKPEILAFLHDHYAAWRKFDTGAADAVAAMTIPQAQRPRALRDIAALGRAWWATGNPEYGAAFERFYSEVPTGEMFSWGDFNGSQGAIELDAWFMLLDCAGFSDEGRIAFLDHLRAITEFAWDDATSQWGQLGLGPEGHNWYLHGMHCLPFVGTLFPEFKRAEFFVHTGMSVIEEHVRGHYRADGGARETTLGYQAGSMRCLWDFYQLAHRNGIALSAGFADHLLAGTRFLLGLMTPDGALPSFGDTQPEAGQLGPLSALATALTGDRECKWYAEHIRRIGGNAGGEPAGELPQAVFWSVGLAGAATYAQTRPRDPRQTSLLMGATGYAAMRATDAPDAEYLAVAAADRGPIVTSHGHNDILAIEVHAAGVKFIGEKGCAPYGKSPGRDYDESTAAHSTVTVDDHEQCPLVNEWRWSRVVIPAVRRWISEPTHDYLHGVHEGYVDADGNETLHARKILFIKPGTGMTGGYWVIMDWLDSKQPHTYRAWFHGCVPGRLDNRTILLGDPKRNTLAVMPPENDRLSVRRVRDAGRSAYIREKRLDPEDYPCFVYSRRATNDCFVWGVFPAAHKQAIPRINRLPVTVNGKPEDAHGASALEIAFAKHTDRICISHKDFDSALDFDGQTAWGHMAFRRVANRTGRLLLAFDHSMADGICGR